MYVCLQNISSFSEKDFDVVEWVNNMLKDKPSDECREVGVHVIRYFQVCTVHTIKRITLVFLYQVIPSMLKKLQLCVEQVHEVLDETTEQVLSSLPKVVSDIEQFENQASTIQQKLIDLKHEINTVIYCL